MNDTLLWPLEEHGARNPSCHAKRTFGFDRTDASTLSTLDSAADQNTLLVCFRQTSIISQGENNRSFRQHRKSSYRGFGRSKPCRRPRLGADWQLNQQPANRWAAGAESVLSRQRFGRRGFVVGRHGWKPADLGRTTHVRFTAPLPLMAFMPHPKVPICAGWMNKFSNGIPLIWIDTNLLILKIN